MNITLHKTILAVVTMKREGVGGGLPVFYVNSEEEREEVAMLLSRILDAVVHDLGNGTYIIVKHS